MGKKLYRPLEGVQLATPTKGFWHCELLPN
jgi:hypothetical protein